MFCSESQHSIHLQRTYFMSSHFFLAFNTVKITRQSKMDKSLRIMWYACTTGNVCDCMGWLVGRCLCVHICGETHRERERQRLMFLLLE